MIQDTYRINVLVIIQSKYKLTEFVPIIICHAIPLSFNKYAHRRLIRATTKS